MKLLKTWVLIAITSVLVCGNLNASLFVYLPFDEITGGFTPDLSGNGRDGQLDNIGSDNLVPGRFGQAFHFSNDEQTLVFLVGHSVTSGPEFTISFWVNAVGAGQNDLRLFSEGSQLSGNPLFNLGTHNAGVDGTIDVYIRNQGAELVNHLHSTSTALDGTWHHIAWVDSGDVGTLYIDGVAEPDPLNSLEHGVGATLPLDTMSFGGILRANPSHHFTGLLDDAAVWETALSPEDIAMLASGTTSPLEIGMPPLPPGSSQDDPILPDNFDDLSLDNLPTWIFEDVPSGAWYDPPSVSAYKFETTSASVFEEILDFPTGFSDPLEVLVGGTSLGTFGPGESVNLGGVSSFVVSGINPLVDAADPLAFPIQLAFDTPTASFTMTGVAAVPEATSIAVWCLLACVGVVFVKFRKS